MPLQRVILLLQEGADFGSSRLPLARALRGAGAEVRVMARPPGGECGLPEGFPLLPWALSRGSLNPLRELRAFVQVLRAYRRLRPGLACHVSIKPVVYGGVAARLLGVPTVSTITGLGFAFAEERWFSRPLRRAVLALLRLALGGGRARVVCQNEDDLETLVRAGVVDRARARVVRGSGVDLARFRPAPPPEGTPVVVLPGRMLRTKGVEDFREAARRLAARGVRARFALVGAPDAANPGSIPAARLRAWSDAGEVEWWGARDDMDAVYARAAVVCVPSHGGEGIPRVLLEGAASGRPLVTTDVPGCRDAVRDGENGRVVPPRDPAALAEAIAAVLADAEMRLRMGERSRALAERDFGVEQVVARTLAICAELADPPRTPQPAAAALPRPPLAGAANPD